MSFKFYYYFFLFTSTILTAQKSEYSVQNISDSLIANANAVVRYEQLDIIITSQDNMLIKTKRVVTILNKLGIEDIEATEYYDKSTSIKNIQAIIYDAFGNEIKKIKRKDFKDQAALSDGALISDNRFIYLDYTPIQYPFTIEYESEIQTSNTAFISPWMPINSYLISVEKSVLNVSFPADLGFKKKEFNFDHYNIKKTEETATKLTYLATNIYSQKREDYSPSFTNIFPRVMMGLNHMHLEGVNGNALSWKEFGIWYSNDILKETTELPETTKVKIKSLVANETDPIKKAKIVYDYVQQKTRYVSIQLGIGGWKPMLASDVDRLGYGDCKALTNYTKALLHAVDVPSYNVILYGSRTKRDIDADFVSMQGNHMILAVPNGDKYIWLECTSQDDPFGYQGTFTDDRNVLVIKPEGGEIVKTTIYEDKNNKQISIGKYSVSETGEFVGTLKINSEGTQYSSKMFLEKASPTEKETHYKEYWSDINNLKLNKISFENDKENVKFIEELEISATNYASITGNKLIFIIDAFNRNSSGVKRIRNRTKPFEISRGYFDTDEIVIELPKGYAIEFLPQNVEYKTKFGDYTTEIIKKDQSTLIYKRNLYIKKGLYTPQEYDEYRLYMEKIGRNDNAKIILIKN